MRLLMITGDRALAEGKRGAFYNTIEEFHKHWDQIDIICPKINSAGNLRPFDNVNIYPSRWPLFLQPFWILKKGKDLFKKNKFNLITVHEYPPFYNGIGARLLWGKIKVPYVLEIFHVPGHPEPSGFKEAIYKQLVKMFISFDSSKAKAVRVMNDEIGRFLADNGVQKNKIVLIPAVYIDFNIFKPLTLPKEYDLIFVGRLESNKGLELFVETIRKLNCRAIIVGDGPLRKSLGAKVKSLRLESNVVFHGWAKDPKEIAELINEAKLLVMASYNEGGPRVVVEALACGVPVLATPVGMVPDLLKDQVNPGGIVIEWNAEDIASKAKALLDNPALYQDYSKNGLKLVSRFEKSSAINNYADKLKALI